MNEVRIRKDGSKQEAECITVAGGRFEEVVSDGLLPVPAGGELNENRKP